MASFWWGRSKLNLALLLVSTRTYTRESDSRPGTASPEGLHLRLYDEFHVLPCVTSGTPLIKANARPVSSHKPEVTADRRRGCDHGLP